VVLRLGDQRRNVRARLTYASLKAWRQRLDSHGFEVRAAYWHAPSEARCSYLVELDDRVAIEVMLRRYHGVRFGWAKSVVARSVHRLGLSAWLARDVTLVVQPRGADVDGWAVLERRAPHPDSMTAAIAEGDRVSRLLVTPWFEASRHVLCLYMDRRGVLTAVAKMPRRPGDIDAIRHEAEVLRTLARTGALSGHLPVVLGLSTTATPFLLETALHGTPADPGTVRARGDGILQAGLDFLARLPATGETARDDAWFTRLIEKPLFDVAVRVALPSMPALVEETLARLEPLRHRSLPLVAEHGDLSHPNLLLDDGAQLGAVDWERSTLRGLPGHDLFFLLQYVAEARHDTFERVGQLDAFDAAFVGPTAWARPWVQRYAAGLSLSAEILPALLLATWARSSAGLVTRIASPTEGAVPAIGGPDEGSETLAIAFAEDRDHALWKHALKRFDELLG
jgi:aminoglycoside phosphotransferase (APT) family kinase protein